MNFINMVKKLNFTYISITGLRKRATLSRPSRFQLQNLLPNIVAQVGDQGRGQGDGRNQNSDAVNDYFQGDVRIATEGNDHRSCTYKEFLACNPNEYDGKGGAIVYTRWIEKMESVHDMSVCKDSQRVKYTAGSFVGKALTWWNSEIHTWGQKHSGYDALDIRDQEETMIIDELAENESLNVMKKKKKTELGENESLNVNKVTTRGRSKINEGTSKSPKNPVKSITSGGLKEHYGRLWEYRHAILDSNPGSTCRLDDEETESGNYYFRRIYVCFKDVKEGWLAGCRKGKGNGNGKGKRARFQVDLGRDLGSFRLLPLSAQLLQKNEKSGVSYRNKWQVNLYVEHSGYDALDIRDQEETMTVNEVDDNLVIKNVTTNDPFLNKLCPDSADFLNVFYRKDWRKLLVYCGRDVEAGRYAGNYNLGSLVTYRWIAHHYAKQLIADTFIPTLKMKTDIKKKILINVSLGQWSTCRLDDEETESGHYYFKRIYVCFKGVKEGWLVGCRKVIGLGGCFLKYTCRRELLVAMGRDANNQMYPIAWAVVKVKNNDYWAILVHRTKPIIKMLEDIRLYIMQRLVEMNRVARNWDHSITPSIRKRLELMKIAQRDWMLIPSGFGELEVPRPPAARTIYETHASVRVRGKGQGVVEVLLEVGVKVVKIWVKAVQLRCHKEEGERGPRGRGSGERGRGKGERGMGMSHRSREMTKDLKKAPASSEEAAGNQRIIFYKKRGRSERIFK
nr:calcium/proton exchanger [Tanacetum cinerariifolium]